jgi:hypothetical protein
MMLSPLQWRIVKLVGYPTFFLLCFALFTFWTFPVDRFAPQVEERLGALLGRDVSVGEVSMSLTGSFALESVEIGLVAEDDEQAEPETEADGEARSSGAGGDAAAKATPHPKYSIEEIDVDIGFIDLLLGELDVEVETEALGGEIAVSYEGPLRSPEAEPAGAIGAAARRAPGLARRGLRTQAGERGQAETVPAPREGAPVEEAKADEGGDPMALKVEATGIQLRQILDLRRKVPVPVSGAVDLYVELSSQTGRFGDAEGRISLAAKQLKVGDSKNPSDIGGMPMTVDEVLISELIWEIDVKEGIGTIDKCAVTSTDFDAKVEGTIAFGDPFARTRLDLYFTFKFLAGYAKKSPTAQMLVSSLPELSNAFRRALRTDGYFGFRYRGQVGTAQFSPSKFYRGKGGRDGERPERKSRRSTGAQAQRALDRGIPTPEGKSPPNAAAADTRSREEIFPDMKPPVGNGPFGVEPLAPPRAPEVQVDPAEERRAAEQNGPPEQVAEPEPQPQEEPQEQPQENVEEQPQENEQPEGEGQGQEEVPPGAFLQ